MVAKEWKRSFDTAALPRLREPMMAMMRLMLFVVTTKKTGGQEGNNEIDRKRAYVDPRVTLREQTAQVTELAQNSPKLFVPRSFLFSSSQARQ